MVSERALRKVSACALPRPSAMASAKLANSTVNHSHSVICKLNQKCSCRRANSSTVVMTLPIFDHEHDRIAHHVPRIQLDQESRMARRTIFASQIAFFLACSATTQVASS